MLLFPVVPMSHLDTGIKMVLWSLEKMDFPSEAPKRLSKKIDFPILGCARCWTTTSKKSLILPVSPCWAF